MKKKDILSCIKENKKISDFELNIVKKYSRELFYVLDHLEINRAVNVENASIRLYVSDGKTTGTSLVQITAADDQKSLAKKIDKALQRAKQAKNPYYPLPEKTGDIRDSKPLNKDLNQIAAKAAQAVFKADHYRSGWINSTEIFVTALDSEFINSKGTHHHTGSFKIEIECIPTWSNKKEEFELYRFYESSKIDYAAITESIDEILKLAKDRSNALTLKDVDIPADVPVLVKDDMLEEIVSALAHDCSYASIFMKQNHYEKGDVVADTAFGLTLKGTIPGCSRSRKYDDNGIVLHSRKIIKAGKINDDHGDMRFGYYLGRKKISGRLPLMQLDGQGISLRGKKHLIIESFSAPQLEPDSGYWGGEVRLARYYDGKRYIPLTGFSIAGSLYEDLKDVAFSKEQCIARNYKGPKYLIFKGLKLS